eukprot:6372066-Pyramimonas_sp.AAC.1
MEQLARSTRRTCDFSSSANSTTAAWLHRVAILAFAHLTRDVAAPERASNTKGQQQGEPGPARASPGHAVAWAPSCSRSRLVKVLAALGCHSMDWAL